MVGGYLNNSVHGPQRPIKNGVEPPSDPDFSVDTWTPLLRQEPLGIVFDSEDRKVFHPGELWLRSEYQALLQMGTTSSLNYSIRATLQPVDRQGQAGLFIGYQHSQDNPDVDVAILLGVTQLTNDKVSVMPCLIELERQGNQLPRILEQPPVSAVMIARPEDGLIRIQADIRQGRLAAIIVNNKPIQLAFRDELVKIDAAGKFGLYVCNTACDFTASEIRITK
jgi:hypothetical protein